MDPSPYDYDLVCIGSGPAGQRGRGAGRQARQARRASSSGAASWAASASTPARFRARPSARRCSRSPAGAGGRPAAVGRLERRPTAEQLLRARGRGDRRARPRSSRTSSAGTTSTSCRGRGVVRGSAHPGSSRATAAGARSPPSTSSSRCGTQPAPPPGVPTDGESILTSDDIVQPEALPAHARRGRRRRHRHRVRVDVRGARRAGHADRAARPAARVPRPRDRGRADPPDAQAGTSPSGSARRWTRIEVERRAPAARRCCSSSPASGSSPTWCCSRSGASAPPSTLNLAAAGLAADERGRLKVDAEFRTAVPHIFAAGDVIGYPSLAATSSEQGRLAACHAFGVAARADGARTSRSASTRSPRSRWSARRSTS